MIVLESMPSAIINSIHTYPEQWLIGGIVFLVAVWVTGIMKIIKNNKKAKRRKNLDSLS